MAVKMVEEYLCFRCHRLKGPLNHWWLVKIIGAEWTFRDFAVQALDDFDYALCSMKCLIQDASEHAAKFLNLRGPDLAAKDAEPNPSKETT